MSDDNQEYQGYQKKIYDGSIIQDSMQRMNDGGKAKRIAEDAMVIQDNAVREETKRILEKTEVTQEEINKVFDDYGKKDTYKEYLVDGAVLTCNKATLQPFDLVEKDGVTKILKLEPRENESKEEYEERVYTTLDVSENPISDNGLMYATVKDTIMNGNIYPFRCHCKVMEESPGELMKILSDPEVKKEGVCRHLMRLNPEWENLPRKKIASAFAKKDIRTVYMKTDDIRKGRNMDMSVPLQEEGIMMTSILFCKHGGIITPVTSGQTDSYSSAIEPENNENAVKVTTISLEYFNFLINYEGLGDTWRYANVLSDGTVTIAFGVVLKDSDGRYLLGEDVYNEYMSMKEDGIPLTQEEARILTETRLQDFINVVKVAADEKNWSLSQNQFDALVDMVWNISPRAIDFTAAELIATGDLNDPIIKQQLEKEILETAHAELDDEDVWSKNLVERRLDIVKIVEGGSDAYTKEELPAQWWNQNAEDFLLEKGLSQETIDKYIIQLVGE